MKKLFYAFFLLCCLLTAAFSNDKVSIFIDISGSMDSQLQAIKQYVTEEYIPSLTPDTELKIYKFYGKIRPPIYDGNLMSDTKVAWAKKQVNALIANGPWTNIVNVLDFISENCVDYGEKFIILTDGINEADEQAKAFEISDNLIKEKLGENATLVTHKKWKRIEFLYEEAKKVEEPQNKIETQAIQPENQKKTLSYINSDTTISKEKSSIKNNLKFILIPVSLILLIIILFLIIKNRNFGSISYPKGERVTVHSPTKTIKVDVDNFVENNASEKKNMTSVEKAKMMKNRQDEIQKKIFEFAEKEGLTKTGNKALSDGISNIDGYNNCPHKVSIVNKEANEPGGGGYAMTEGWTKENLNSPTQKYTEKIAAILQGKIENPSNDSIEKHMSSSDYAIGDSNYVNISKIVAGKTTNTDELLKKGKIWAQITKMQMENADSEIIYCGGDGVLQSLEETLGVKKGNSIYKGKSELIKGVYKINGKTYINACHPSYLGYQNKDEIMLFFNELANIRDGK